MKGISKGRKILCLGLLVTMVAASLGGLLYKIKLGGVNAEGEFFNTEAYASHWGYSNIRQYLNSEIYSSSNDILIEGKNAYYAESVYDSTATQINYIDNFYADEAARIISNNGTEITTDVTYHYVDGEDETGKFYKKYNKETYNTIDNIYLPSGKKNCNILSWGKDDISSDEKYEEIVINGGDKQHLIPSNYIAAPYYKSGEKADYWLRSSVGRYPLYYGNVSPKQDGTNIEKSVAPILKLNIKDISFASKVDVPARGTSAYNNSDILHSNEDYTNLILRKKSNISDEDIFNPTSVEIKKEGTNEYYLDITNDALVQSGSGNYKVVVQATHKSAAGSSVAGTRYAEEFVAYGALATGDKATTRLDVSNWQNGSDAEKMRYLSNYVFKIWVEKCEDNEKNARKTVRIREATEPKTFESTALGATGKLVSEANFKSSNTHYLRHFATADELQCSWGDLNKLSSEQEVGVGTTYYQLFLQYGVVKSDNYDIKQVTGATDQKITLGLKKMDFWIAGREDDNGNISESGNILVLYATGEQPKIKEKFSYYEVNEKVDGGYYKDPYAVISLPNKYVEKVEYQDSEGNNQTKDIVIGKVTFGGKSNQKTVKDLLSKQMQVLYKDTVYELDTNESTIDIYKSNGVLQDFTYVYNSNNTGEYYFSNGGTKLMQKFTLQYCNANDSLVNQEGNWTQEGEWLDGLPEASGKYKIRIITPQLDTDKFSSNKYTSVYTLPANLEVAKGEQNFAMTLNNKKLADLKKENGRVVFTYGDEDIKLDTTIDKVIYNASKKVYEDGYIDEAVSYSIVDDPENPGVATLNESEKTIHINKAGNFQIVAKAQETDKFNASEEVRIDVTIKPKSILDSKDNTKLDSRFELKIVDGFDENTINDNTEIIYKQNNGQDNAVAKVSSFKFDDADLVKDTDYVVEHKIFDVNGSNIWKDENGVAHKQIKKQITITGTNNFADAISKIYYIKDETKPKATITIKGTDNVFEKLLNKLSFGMFFHDTKEIVIDASDLIDDGSVTGSGVASIKYYIDKDNALGIGDSITEEALTQKLDEVQDWQDYSDSNKPKVGAASEGGKVDGKYIVYAKIEDNAGNIYYLSSNGIVLYTDSSFDSKENANSHNYVKTTKEGQSFYLQLNGNEINKVEYQNTSSVGNPYTVIKPENYELTKHKSDDDNSELTYDEIYLKPEFINTLLEGNYKLKISVNPQGVSYQSNIANGSDQNSIPVSLEKEFIVSKRELTASELKFNPYKTAEGNDFAYDTGNFESPTLREIDPVLSGISLPKLTFTYYKFDEETQEYSRIGSAKPQSNPGKYRWTVKVNGDENYQASKTELENEDWVMNLVIADPNYEVPAFIESTYGETLQDVNKRLIASGSRWRFIDTDKQDLKTTTVGMVESKQEDYLKFEAEYRPINQNYGVVRNTIAVRVSPRDLSLSEENVTVTLDQSTYTYDGSAWYPQIIVKRGSDEIDGANYTIKYADDMVSIGEKVITVNFIGNYTGSKTVTGLIDVNKSKWGSEKVVNNIKHYVASNGATSVEVKEENKDENGIIWLKEDSDGTSAWYGIKYPTGVFADSSRFYVNWLSKTANKAAWQEAYNQLDESHKNKQSSGRMLIFQIGVVDPYGKEYKNFSSAVSLYVQLGTDWSKDDINAVYVQEGPDEVINVSYEENRSFIGGRANFANLTLNHFSAYCVYDGTKLKTIDIINNTNQDSTIGALDSGFASDSNDYSDYSEGSLNGLRTVNRIRDKNDSEGDEAEFVSNDKINIKEQSKSSSIAIWLVAIIAILGIVLIVIMRMQRKYGVKYYFDMLKYKTKNTWYFLQDKTKELFSRQRH